MRIGHLTVSRATLSLATTRATVGLSNHSGQLMPVNTNILCKSDLSAGIGFGNAGLKRSGDCVAIQLRFSAQP